MSLSVRGTVTNTASLTSQPSWGEASGGPTRILMNPLICDGKKVG